MSDANALAGYRRMLDATGVTATFRRVSGQAPNATTFDAVVSALFRSYQPTTPVGQAAGPADITQGLREFIVLESDLAAAFFPLPLVKNDRIIADGELFTITEVDIGTRRFAGAIGGKAIGV